MFEFGSVAFGAAALESESLLPSRVNPKSCRIRLISSGGAEFPLAISRTGRFISVTKSTQ